MIERTEIHRDVAAYVERLVGRAVDPAEAIISSGLLESISAVQLVVFIESHFGLGVNDDELKLASFDSVEAITTLVATKLDGAQ